jgi:DNA-binding response OmpR family regulator
MNEPEKKPRVLLVEDDLTLASLYQMRMENEGFEVRQCNDGEQALQAAKEFRPDLILLDIMMPKLNGFDTLDILRHTAGLESIKVVILSALGQPDDIERAKKLGADDYLVKSQVVIGDVMVRLRQLLGLPPSQPPVEAA